MKNNGGVAQMVERSLSMREVPGSIPGASNSFLILYIMITFCSFSGYVIINRTKKIRRVYTTVRNTNAINLSLAEWSTELPSKKWRRHHGFEKEYVSCVKYVCDMCELQLFVQKRYTEEFRNRCIVIKWNWVSDRYWCLQKGKTNDSLIIWLRTAYKLISHKSVLSCCSEL